MLPTKAATSILASSSFLCRSCEHQRKLSSRYGKTSTSLIFKMTVVDFSDLAQGCKTYDEFVEKMGHNPESTLQYFGVAICGPKKKVNKLTGSMPLLR